MKKRVLALVMSTAVIASVLTACGGKNDAPAQDTNTNTNNDAPAAATTSSLARSPASMITKSRIRCVKSGR